MSRNWIANASGYGTFCLCKRKIVRNGMRKDKIVQKENDVELIVGCCLLSRLIAGKGDSLLSRLIAGD